MDWTFAIERHRLPLLALVTELFDRIGLTEDGSVERISKPLHRFVLSLLRPAESAVRRLIIAAARDIVVEPRKPRPSKPRPKTSTKDKIDGEAKPRRKRRPLFSLFDPLKRLKKFFGRRPKRRRVEPHVYSLEAFLQRPPPPPVVE